MSTVPELYRLQCQGVGDTEFRRMCESPKDEREEILGQTYRHLFSTSPSAQPLRADFVDGEGLVVQAGQHRVLEAKRAGVPFLPVHVSAPEVQQLEKLRTAFETEVRGLGAEHALVPDVQRRHEEHQQLDRQLSSDARPGVPDHHPGRERLEPERERDWLRPERER